MAKIDRDEVMSLAERVTITVEAFKPMIRREDGSEYGFTTFKFSTTAVQRHDGTEIGHIGSGTGYLTFWFREAQEEWLISHEELWHAMTKARSRAEADALRDALGVRTITERLEALTPGGSEYHDDPESCLDYLERREAAAVEQARQRQALAAQRQQLMNMLARRASELAAISDDPRQMGRREAYEAVLAWLEKQ